jgi:hypothetical protein
MADKNVDFFKLHGRQLENLEDHSRRMEAMWEIADNFHQNQSIDFDPMTFLLLWRNKREISRVFMRASKAMIAAVDDCPLVEEWRGATPKNMHICREILILLHEKDRITLSEAEVACQIIAKRESVRQCLKLGVEINVLEKTGEHYSASEGILREMVLRATSKIADQDIRAMSDIVTAYNTMRELMQTTNALEKNNPLPQDSPKTIHEMMHVFGTDSHGNYNEKRKKDKD